MVGKQAGVQEFAVITGVDFLAIANKPNAGIIFARLKPWRERTTPELDVWHQMSQTLAIGRSVPEATVLSFNAVSLPGIGRSGGFTIMLEDRGGGSDAEIDAVSKQFLAAARAAAGNRDDLLQFPGRYSWI